MTAGRWFAQGHLPRTDLIGTTRYAEAIERVTDGLVTRAQLHADIQAAIGINSTAA